MVPELIMFRFSFLAHCLGHFLGPLQFLPLFVYLIWPTGRTQQVFRPAANTLPVGLDLNF